MQDIGLMKLNQIIYEYCGLGYTDRLMILKKKLSKRLTELCLSPLGYYEFLIKNPSEWEIVVELLTINETYFYREENQLVECCNHVLPILKKKHRNRPLRIWSAACSTGEEPYTLAMLIHDSGLFLPGAIEIIATDINKKVLEKAEKGWYFNGSFAFRRIPKRLLEKYFSQKENGYQVNPSIQNMVEFRHLNLLDSEKIPEIGEVDVVFCRNVLIYFDRETTTKVIKNLNMNLTLGGYLFLGHAESVSDASLGFKKVESDTTIYYRKESDISEKVRCINSR